MGVGALLFYLLRNEICRTELPDSLIISNCEAEQLYHISKNMI